MRSTSSFKDFCRHWSIGGALLCSLAFPLGGRGFAIEQLGAVPPEAPLAESRGAATETIEANDGRVARSSKGIVVSEHPLASAAGVDVLRRGGNAIDAAVATGLALAVVHPTAGNLGGGGFLVYRRADGHTTTIDFRETAPAAATAEMFLDDQGQLIRGSNHRGMRSVGVPGTVAGFSLALERYGTKTWATVSRRAIELADEGFLLDESLAEELAEYELDWRDQPSAAQVFLRPSGECFHAGDRWRQPELAETLARLAVQGPEDFYRGEIARRLSRGIQSEGGLITTDDLAGYRPIERAPVLGTYREFEIISMSAPSSGGATLLEMLGILEGFPLSEYAHNSPEYLHLLAETMQLAYCDRARFLGDPDADPEVLAHVTWMLDPTHHAFQRSQLSQTAHRAAAPEDLAVTASIESPQTTHFSVIDSAGNAVSVTYTLEQAYGSRLVAPGLGFLLNNQMGDFNPWPGVTDTTGLIGTPPNQIAPGKRMLSSMSPTIVVRDGQPWLIVGSPGGRTIINTVLQVILNSVDFEMPLPDAVAAPRVHHQWLPDRLEIESELARPDLLQALTTLGHATRVVEEQGRVMAIRIDGPDRRGVADPRAPSGTAAAEDFR